MNDRIKYQTIKYTLFMWQHTTFIIFNYKMRFSNRGIKMEFFAFNYLILDAHDF